ncbi:MAG: Glu-tRNA(Gln) amidotransferase subunit GatD, partial [Thermoplasmatota archaeon]
MSEREQALREIDAGPGDRIRIVKAGKIYEGILMPRHAFSSPDVVTIKLDSGYNVGLSIEDAELSLVEKRGPHPQQARKASFDPDKPSVALLGTGGTIASYVDYETGAVHPARTSEEIMCSVPGICEVCNIESEVIARKLSENITPGDWAAIAESAAEKLNRGADGVIVAHGTDTMGYTAAALSFMLQDLSGPVVLVGSQRSSDRPSSDAFQNLVAAARMATTDLGEVAVVMHAEPSPGLCAVHRGTRVRKMHASRRDAFRSIDSRPLAFVDDTVRFIGSYRRKTAGETRVTADIDDNVALVYAHPGLHENDFAAMTEGRDGVVVAGTGLGHVNEELIPVIRELTGNGVPVVMTTQCIWGRVMNPQLRNVAAVMIHADLPPFAKPGQTIHITVSSIGNAGSLRGASLLMTPLKGADGQTYAMAQGNLVVGGLGAEGRDGRSSPLSRRSAPQHRSSSLTTGVMPTAFIKRTASRAAS